MLTMRKSARFFAAVTALAGCYMSTFIGSARSAVTPQAFFQEPPQQQIKDFSGYDFEDQYALYVYGNQQIEPPSFYLRRPFARDGAKIVKPLMAKLSQTSNEVTIRDIVLVFGAMQDLNTYDVSRNKLLMETLRQRVNGMKGIWKNMCTKTLREIESAGQRKH